MLGRTHLGLNSHRNWGGQVAHAHQIVGGGGESKNLIDATHSAIPNLPHQRNRLQPAETFFYPLPLPLTDAVTGMPRRATINRAATGTRMILRHMRSHSQMTAFFHKIPRVESLSPPTATGCLPGTFSNIISAASRSAVAVALKDFRADNQLRCHCPLTCPQLSFT